MLRELEGEMVVMLIYIKQGVRNARGIYLIF